LAKAGDPAFLPQTAATIMQILMAATVDGKIGAGRHELSREGIACRNSNPRPALFKPASNVEKE
jgi:hypothetical protein